MMRWFTAELIVVGPTGAVKLGNRRISLNEKGELGRSGAISQDIVTLPLAAVFLLLLWSYARNGGVAGLIGVIGGLGYFFYAYGL